jgi:hypothetical protein
MLHTPAPFPHPGAIAYLAPAALKVRIVQHKPDGPDGPLVLVSVPEQRCCNPAETAFNPRTVPLADLFPDAESCMLAGRPARRRARNRARANSAHPELVEGQPRT